MRASRGLSYDDTRFPGKVQTELDRHTLGWLGRVLHGLKHLCRERPSPPKPFAKRTSKTPDSLLPAAKRHHILGLIGQLSQNNLAIPQRDLNKIWHEPCSSK
jgi:hypothetical protein